MMDLLVKESDELPDCSGAAGPRRCDVVPRAPVGSSGGGRASRLAPSGHARAAWPGCLACTASPPMARVTLGPSATPLPGPCPAQRLSLARPALAARATAGLTADIRDRPGDGGHRRGLGHRRLGAGHPRPLDEARRDPVDGAPLSSTSGGQAPAIQATVVLGRATCRPSARGGPYPARLSTRTTLAHHAGPWHHRHHRCQCRHRQRHLAVNEQDVLRWNGHRWRVVTVGTRLSTRPCAAHRRLRAVRTEHLGRRGRGELGGRQDRGDRALERPLLASLEGTCRAEWQPRSR